MDKRTFLKGLAAAITVAVLPKALKSEALASTSISPPITRAFHVRYDSIAMSYIKDVLGRTEPLTVREEKIKEGWVPKSVNQYTHLVPPDPARAAFFLEAERRDREYKSKSAWMPAGWSNDGFYE